MTRCAEFSFAAVVSQLLHPVPLVNPHYSTVECLSSFLVQKPEDHSHNDSRCVHLTTQRVICCSLHARLHINNCFGRLSRERFVAKVLVA